MQKLAAIPVLAATPMLSSTRPGFDVISVIVGSIPDVCMCGTRLSSIHPGRCGTSRVARMRRQPEGLLRNRRRRRLPRKNAGGGRGGGGAIKFQDLHPDQQHSILRLVVDLERKRWSIVANPVPGDLFTRLGVDGRLVSTSWTSDLVYYNQDGDATGRISLYGILREKGREAVKAPASFQYSRSLATAEAL